MEKGGTHGTVEGGRRRMELLVGRAVLMGVGRAEGEMRQHIVGKGTWSPDG